MKGPSRKDPFQGMIFRFAAQRVPREPKRFLGFWALPYTSAAHHDAEAGVIMTIHDGHAVSGSHLRVRLQRSLCPVQAHSASFASTQLHSHSGCHANNSAGCATVFHLHVGEEAQAHAWTAHGRLVAGICRV